MKRQFILFSLCYVLMQGSYCRDIGTLSDKRFVLGLDAGAAKTKQLSQSAHFQLGYSTFNYLPDRDASTTRYGISLGRRFPLNPLNSFIIGLSYHQFSSMAVRGTLQQGIFPPLYSANYEYTIELSQLLIDAKLQHQWGQRFYPYLIAGIGAGFNRAEHFYTTVPGYLTITPTYANHDRSSLSYALGLGIDTLLAPNVTAGIGYLFSDLGPVGLGDGAIRQTHVSNHLSQSHLHMNTVLAQISWSI